MNQSLSRRSFLAAAGATLANGWISPAQSSGGSGAKSSAAVPLFVTVHDKQGNIISGLAKEDFEIFDKGRKQTISHFSHDPDLPLTLGLLIDTSCSQRNALDGEKQAARGFIRKVLREDKDHAFVVDFDARAELAQDVTSSRTNLEQSLDRIHVSQCRVEKLENGGTLQIGSRGVGTRLYEVVYTASERLMSKRSGHKALILLTDGMDRGSRTTLSKAIEQVQRADTLVYSVAFGSDFIYFEKDQGLAGFEAERPSPPSGVDAGDVLRRISRESGGACFAVSKKVSLEQIYNRIGEELRNQYSLGFIPDKRDRGFHKLVLTLRQKDMIVRARAGYYQGP